MYNWFDLNDHSTPIITADGHVRSTHGNPVEVKLPRTCVLFEIGVSIEHLESHYNTSTIVGQLPCFLDNPKCIVVDDIPNVCFVRGGYGAPAAVDTLETLLALGVERIIVSGMCGVFVEGIEVGDILIPIRIRREEGTSYHYLESTCLAEPDGSLHQQARDFFLDAFRVSTEMTVSSDAVYRQTFQKEKVWREQGAVGVDMEASALLSVCSYYKIPAVALLLASDKHPLSEGENEWNWGDTGFAQKRLDFIDKCVAFARSLG